MAKRKTNFGKFSSSGGRNKRFSGMYFTLGSRFKTKKEAKLYFQSIKRRNMYGRIIKGKNKYFPYDVYYAKK